MLARVDPALTSSRSRLLRACCCFCAEATGAAWLLALFRYLGHEMD